ncbi:hypothetical protein [Flavobacterium macrobrachii]|uniref:DUF2306 domain-containing protein n=1 Tax=Flavobacterium macrobrachii TaxID=591204 RepID=A0ABS2CZG5_9FLAO|nr:hypothetical protein [Flavobacterium macrobrachii]MBM6500357.1 hypothetical protein [Flavobacterium macrobrachii]
METIFTILLIIHIIAGSIGLLTGTINIIKKKGDKTHKSVGKFFFYSMLINGFAGFIMSLIHRNDFLLIVAVFSIYMVATGQRFLSLKQLNKEQKPKAIDWILTYTMLVFAFLFITYGSYLLINKVYFGIVLLVFGVVCCLMAIKDIKVYKGNIKEKNYWLLLHIQRMVGSYIAALTAFIVVNNHFLPGIVGWLLPTVIFTPLIVKWTKQYRVQI